MDSSDSLTELFGKMSVENRSTPCQSLLEEINCNIRNQDVVPTEDGKKFPTIENETLFTTSVPFKLLKNGSTVEITVLNIINPNYFFVREKSQIDEQVNTSYQQLQYKMKQLYDGSTSIKWSWKCGDIGAAILKFDNKWHRVMLDTIGKTQAEIHCIDTGHFQDVSLTDCFPLLPCIANQKPLALACCIDSICCSRYIQYWPADIVKSFSSWLKSQHVTMTVLSTLHNIHFVHIKFYQLTKAFQVSTELLKYQSIIVRNNHNERDVATNRMHNYQRILQRPSPCIIPAMTIPNMQPIDINATTVVNPSLFWLNLMGRHKGKCSKMNKTAFNILDEKMCNIDSVVLVRNDRGDKFRGQVKQFLTHNYILVQDIDSGWVSSALLGKDIAELSNNQKRMPAMAKKCRLELSLHENHLGSSALHLFFSLIISSKLKASFCKKLVDTHSVKLYKIDQTYTVEINKILEQALVTVNEVMESSGNNNNNKSIPDVHDNIAATASNLNYEMHLLTNNQLPTMHCNGSVTNMPSCNLRPQHLTIANRMSIINHHYLYDRNTARLQNHDKLAWIDYHHQRNRYINSQSQCGPNSRLPWRPYGPSYLHYGDLGYDRHTNCPYLQQDMVRHRMYYDPPTFRSQAPNYPCPLSQPGQLHYRCRNARPDQTMIRPAPPRMPQPLIDINPRINVRNYSTVR